mmetsp:Transcript_20121/g.36410  ORF Transcript_20121/g.36410 Transcript_20121/m.36410 type:complete len:295 (+) Transcript_20121:88-972(+)
MLFSELPWRGCEEDVTQWMEFSALPGCSWSLRDIAHPAELGAEGNQDPTECALRGPLIHVVTPGGDHICSVSSASVPRAADLKKHVSVEIGMPISRQRLLLGSELADNVALRGDRCEDAMIITLDTLPPNAAEVFISSASSGRFVGVDSSGALAPGERRQVFIARPAEDNEFVLQVGEGPHVGSFVTALFGPPFSKASALVLQSEPERWRLVPLHNHTPTAGEAVVYGLMLASRTYAALGGLYCHEAEGDHYHLVQHAGLHCDHLDGFRITRAAVENESAISLVDDRPSLRLDH